VRRTLTAVRRSARSLAVLAAATSLVAASTLAYADGIDISHWQGHVDWGKVRSDNVTFAFMKATEGTYYADPTLHSNWDGAEKVGIYRAAYHFARPSRVKGSAEAQARYFVSQAGRFANKGDLPPVLDLEVTGGLAPRALRPWVATWLATVQRLTGRTPILYFSPYFWIDHMGNSTAFTRYPLWIAHYTTKAPLVPGGWKAWTFWQRTSSGHVDGISGLVDMNRFNGSGQQLARLANTTGGSSDPPPGGPTVPPGAPTSLSLAPARTTVAIDARIGFSGDLRTTTRPVASAPHVSVSLWARSPGNPRWARVAVGSTDRDGHYRLDARVRWTADYQTRSAGTTTYAPAVSAPARVTTPARAAVSLDLRRDRTVGAPGAALVLFGHLTTGTRARGLAGQPVRYDKRSLDGRSWIHVGTSHSAAPTGWHSLTVHPRLSRVWRAVFVGSDRYAPRTSAYLTVRVR
jgi:GH25 family lysozyme M1 (1,4-beta-N-acetylmuramidase)